MLGRWRNIFAERGRPGMKLQNATAVCPRESWEVVITTCRYGRNEILCSNETPAGYNVAPEPSEGEFAGSKGFSRTSVYRSIGCRKIDNERTERQRKKEEKFTHFLLQENIIAIFSQVVKK